MSFFSFLFFTLIIQVIMIIESWNDNFSTEKMLFFLSCSFFCGALISYLISE